MWLILKLSFQETSGAQEQEEMEKEMEEYFEGLSGSYYMIYAFEKGTFVLNGDGGFNNFACSGKYTHSGNRYRFYPM